MQSRSILAICCTVWARMVSAPAVATNVSSSVYGTRSSRIERSPVASM